MAVASGTRVNRQLARDANYTANVTTVYKRSILVKPVTCTYCRTHMNVILFQSKKCTVHTTTVEM